MSKSALRLSKAVARTVVMAWLMVAAGDGHAVGAVLPISPGSWTLAILPDTQTYAYPETSAMFYSQTGFLRDHAADLNLKYVLQEGDVVNDNLNWQWDIARGAMDQLNGVVPYAMVTGNHDVGVNGSPGNRESAFNNPMYFGPGSYYASQSSIGGFYSTTKTASSWHTFNDGTQNWLIMNLEWAPQNEVLTWADQILDAHPDYRTIVLTHAYMYSDNNRYDWPKYGTGQYGNPHSIPPIWLGPPDNVVNDGEEIWNKLIRTHNNVDFVFSGHVLSPGTGYRSDLSDGGHVVHQLLANSQDDPNGRGNMRLLEFKTDGSVDVRTYSPWFDRYTTTATQQFTVQLDQLDPPNGQSTITPLVWRALAANLVVAGATNPTTNTVGTITVPQSSTPGFIVPLANRGDYEIAVDGTPLKYTDGVLLASITQHERPDFVGHHASVEVGRDSFGDGNLALSLTEAGSAWIGNEVNFNTSVAWFKFQAGFRGAHVYSDGSLAAGAFNGVTQANVTHPATGRYTVKLGVNSKTDGMLFVTGDNNHNTVVQTGPLADASGWDVRVAYSGSDFGTANSGEHWSFLYLPFSAPGLVGGYYNGANGQTTASAGNFTMTRLATGQYELAVNGQTPQTGMLVLSVANLLTIGNVTSPDDNILTYEPSANGTFLINAYDAPSFGLEDTTFAWAFIGFANGVAPYPLVGDYNHDNHIDMSDYDTWRAQYGSTGSLSADGNHDGVVNTADYVIWRKAVTTGGAATSPGVGAAFHVPEPACISLIVMALSGMALKYRRRCMPQS